MAITDINEFAHLTDADIDVSGGNRTRSDATSNNPAASVTLGT